MATKNRSFHELKTRFAHLTASDMYCFYEKYVYINLHNTTGEHIWNLYEMKVDEEKEIESLNNEYADNEDELTRKYNQD